ncbi:MAG: SDR family NAD(P)-dependent oxidoreductase [Acidimicrobiales bacterium]|jgi:NAD(P)-dependent dehydrogenase (short-subunit alcohol dehydrogenase family)
MNKSVLITGATSGIGQAAAGQLADRGYNVFATYRNPRDRQALAKQSGVSPIQMDLRDPVQIRTTIAAIGEMLGDSGLYAVINNAGISYTAPFEYAELDRVRDIIDVNLVAPYLVTQASLPLLLRQIGSDRNKPRVVNVASWAGMMASPFIGFYNATKSGLIGLTESTYYDLGLLGIHAVLAIPGITKTPLLAKTTDGGLASLDVMPPEGRDRYLPYLEHLATMSGSSEEMRMLLTPEKVANKIVAIVEERKPRFKYDLAIDAKIVDKVVSRMLPFRARAAISRRMYRLNEPMIWPEPVSLANAAA